MSQLTNAGWPAFILIFTLLMLTLYVAREPAHRAINGLFGGLQRSLKLMSKALSINVLQLKQRNREVLLNLGREQGAREINKEFHEISQFVHRDLGGYPELQQRIREQLNHIQAEHESSQLVPGELPEWTDAVESLTKLKSSNPGAHTKVLEQIHRTAELQHKENLRAYSEANSKRYQALQKILPFWRQLSFSIDNTGKRLEEIEKRSEKIDTQMARFEEINAGSDQAIRFLNMSAITQFLVSALVIAIAVGGAFFNFHLIALPMSEMVGSVQRVGGVKVSDLAALVIICMEMCAGIFLLEGLRITKLFPMISSMDNKTRRVIVITSLCVLITLACTESALAFMRDQIANDLAVLRSSLAGTPEEALVQPTGSQHWIPLAANMVLGFVLPIALTMIAIPLEYLLQSGRTLIGNMFAYALSGIALCLRILSGLFGHVGKLLTAAYDLLIAGPIFIESLVKKKKAQSNDTSEAEAWDEDLESSRNGGKS